ncbi:MAG TPA: glutathione S-transferase family protein [Acetobacteraceae bacterium]|nr:glutathione S-transferase family protein [Acetobacteraceae bacterium]
MLLYNSIGPNPKVVRMFMAERGIELRRQEVDLRGAENRQTPYLGKNPAGQCPALELDDGTVLAEITAICEYLDETFPGPSLIGNTPEQRAETRMWARRIDLNILEPMANGFRYDEGLEMFREGLEMFRNRIHCIPGAAADLKQIAQEWLSRLDRMMDGKRFVCGDRMTLADILLFCFVDFFADFGQPLNPELHNIVAWHARMKSRQSAAA